MTVTWLTVRTPNRRPLTVLLDGPLVIGRECDGLVLADQRVSRRHSSLEPIDGKVRVTDLDSSNGTVVNGRLITEPTMAADGDMITVGNTLVSIHAGERHGAGPAIRTELATPDQTHKTSIEVVADAVDEDVAAQVVGAEDQPGTLTVVFSDIESSTELAVAMGDAAWFEILRRHHQLVSAHVEAHRGRIVKNQGDGYMLCFRSARQALLASIGVQRDLGRMGPAMPGGRRAAAVDSPDSGGVDPTAPLLRVRIGAHTGEVMMQDDGDLFGRHVIVAARIGAVASGGQILVSNLLKQIAEPRGDIPFGPALEIRLKGIDGLALVHDVDWTDYAGG